MNPARAIGFCLIVFAAPDLIEMQENNVQVRVSADQWCSVRSRPKMLLPVDLVNESTTSTAFPICSRRSP